ncbi:NAD(P)-binding domain-containing protein [Candidatus Marinimicrobia bacterium]|nr:NAD(P)-binding domain-containing protein [Candidatus Neomarinimicrobiota bacterium]
MKKISFSNNIKTGFMIGNTAKIDQVNNYFTPVRVFNRMVIGGVIINSELLAMEISRYIDGKVEYVLVDAEKKVSDSSSINGNPANIERIVREEISHSKLLTYKGNDLSADAVDAFISYKYKDILRGVGGKKICIIGSGNLGSKLALKLVERGAQVTITRRNKKKLKLITEALNIIRPIYTTEKVKYETDNEKAAEDVDILIGATNGNPTITEHMVDILNDDAIIIDAGKGNLYEGAINRARDKKIQIFRLDVTSALAGMIESQLTNENIFNFKMGRKFYKNKQFVAGGVFAKKGEIVVDNISNPSLFIGISDGRGDFDRTLSESDEDSYKKLIIQLKNEAGED